MIETVDIQNYGILRSKVPEDLFLELKSESTYAINKNPRMHTNFFGEGIADHFFVKDSFLSLQAYVMSLVLEYNKRYTYLSELMYLDRDVPLGINDAWFNYQNKNQYIPSHVHSGVFSFVIWINIPYNILEEKKLGKSTSVFEFSTVNIVGGTVLTQLEISKEWEGNIIFFPSKVPHQVYPFRTSDGTRISVSGNIMLKP